MERRKSEGREEGRAVKRRRQIRQKWKTRLYLLVLCLGFVMLMSMLRHRGGVIIGESTLPSFVAELPLYRQDDARWGEDTLGESAYTMEKSGCLVTCIAAALSTEEEPVTPGQLNQRFSEAGVYDREGNLQWDKAEGLDGIQVKVYQSHYREEMDHLLKEGKYPILCVRRHGWGNRHYVLATGVKDGEFLCMDPLEGRLVKLSEYGSRIYLLRSVWREI